MNEYNKMFWQAMLTVLMLAAFGVVCFIAGSETDSVIFVIIGIVLTGFAIWGFVNLINEELQEKNNNNGESTGGKYIGCSTFMWVIIIAIIIAFFTMCSGGNDNKYDVVYDEDGFLGYSDSFWDWVADQ
ncbi:MAG: hypothetical protein IJ306_10015 [Oscillospiraceae bacterium]|nr:hypothetical protein [Oscillospiraceae bacterium]